MKVEAIAQGVFGLWVVWFLVCWIKKKIMINLRLVDRMLEMKTETKVNNNS